MANRCNLALHARAQELGFADKVYWDFRNVGTHSWEYWDQSMKDFYPLMARGFGIDAGPVTVYTNPALATGDLSSVATLGSSRAKIEEFAFRGGFFRLLEFLFRLFGFTHVADSFAQAEGSANFEGSDNRSVGSSDKTALSTHKAIGTVGGALTRLFYALFPGAARQEG